MSKEVLTVKIDRDFLIHPKVVGLSAEALGVWFKAILWVKDRESDGRISAEAADRLELPPRGIAALVKVGLWEVATEFDGWMFHDYLQRNESSARAQEKLEAHRRRMAKYRAKQGAQSSHSDASHHAEHPSKAPEPGTMLEPNSAARAAIKAAERTSNVVSIDAARSAESIGAQWYSALTSTTPDFNSWRSFYATIGAKPKHERDKVAQHARETTYFAACPSACSPEHFVTYWHDFLVRPRNSDRARPLVKTRPAFQPGAPSSRQEIERLAATKNPDWAKAP